MILEQVTRDQSHFRGLLDLIPPQSYFSKEDQEEIWGTTQDDEDDDDSGFKKKKNKKHKLSAFTVTEIAEFRQKGQTIGEKLKKQRFADTDLDDRSKSIAAKHEGKKHSRNQKSKKKAKELQRRESRLEELKIKLHAKIVEIKARKTSGKPLSSQEQKKLKRQEKKVTSKLKQKNKNHKTEPAAAQLAEGLKSPPQNKIVNQNGDPVRTKFDFSVISFGNDKKSSDLRGRDYKRLLDKVERRKQKVDELKEKDAEAGSKLEQKIQWQAVLSKAQGEKVKDDPVLLKKAAKKKEKDSSRKKKKWGDRKKTVDETLKKKVDKREKNLEKRKTDKKDKKRKSLIKRGRIIPGF